MDWSLLLKFLIWFLTDKFLVPPHEAYVHITGNSKYYIFLLMWTSIARTLKFTFIGGTHSGNPGFSSAWASSQQYPGFYRISGLGADMLLSASHPFSSPMRKLAQSLGNLLKVPELPCSPRLEHFLHTLPACRDYSHF